MLLTVTPCQKSYEKLQTDNKVIHDTFHVTCYALRLLHDNMEWIDCLNEAVVFMRDSGIHRLIALALICGRITDLIEV